jgi:choline dehydrogenase
MECVRLCREAGNAPAFSSLTKREAYPGLLGDAELEAFVRNAAVPFWHYTCSAKMGRDDMSVVDGNLRVYGIDGLRVADGSIMPNVTTGNTMSPCVIIGERGAEIIRKGRAVRSKQDLHSGVERVDEPELKSRERLAECAPRRLRVIHLDSPGT